MQYNNTWKLPKSFSQFLQLILVSFQVHEALLVIEQMKHLLKQISNGNKKNYPLRNKRIIATKFVISHDYVDAIVISVF